MKRRVIAIVVAILIVMGMVAIFGLGLRRTQPSVALPNPNGYDDFAEAAQTLVPWNGDLTALPPETVQGILNQNAKTLELARRGLKKECAMPVVNDKNWLPGQMTQVTDFRRIAQLFVAEGRAQLADGRTDDAARSFADCIVFGHAAHRHGLMIHELVASACQATGARQLVPVAPNISPDVAREILRALLAVEREREPAGAILRRDRQWGRGAYGMWRVMWQNIALRSQTRAMESNFEQKETRSVTALRLVIAELAVRGFQAKTGKPPATLADLVPAWLPAVPLDPYTHQPLVYRVTTNSFFQIYSVGPDGKDNQGAPLKRGGIEIGDLLP